MYIFTLTLQSQLNFWVHIGQSLLLFLKMQMEASWSWSIEPIIAPIIAVQIINMFLLHKPMACFCRKCSEYPRVQKYLSWQETTVLDCGTTKWLTYQEIHDFISAERQVQETELIHNRMFTIHKGLIYISKGYRCAKWRRECCIRLTKEGTEIALFFNWFDTQTTFPLTQNSAFVPHIKFIRGSQSPLHLI